MASVSLRQAHWEGASQGRPPASLSLPQGHPGVRTRLRPRPGSAGRRTPPGIPRGGGHQPRMGGDRAPAAHSRLSLCLSHFLSWPHPPQCTEEGNRVRTHAAPVLPREGKPGREAAMNVDHEVNLLVEEIHRLGSKNADGKLSVKFGVLFRDDKCANLFEALVGTLKAAKRRKIVTYSGELLLQGVHDDVDIVLLQD